MSVVSYIVCDVCEKKLLKHDLLNYNTFYYTSYGPYCNPSLQISECNLLHMCVTCEKQHFPHLWTPKKEDNADS